MITKRNILIKEIYLKESILQPGYCSSTDAKTSASCEQTNEHCKQILLADTGFIRWTNERTLQANFAC